MGITPRKNRLKRKNVAKVRVKRTPRANLSQELLEHYQSQQYRAISNAVILRACYRCQICNGKATECHHRTYRTIKTPQEIGDLIAVCRKCHKVCDARRRLEYAY